MEAISVSKSNRRQMTYFIIALIICAVPYVMYGVNIVKWQNSPDFGWRPMYDSGPNVIDELFDRGKDAGLRVGDTILAINGKEFSTFDELYFEVRDNELGSVNTYTILRDGKKMDISITTGRLGLGAVLRRSLPIFIIGLLYFFVGVLVFLMKPRASESWLFFIMTCFLGMEVSFIAPSDLLRPLWFYDIRLFIDCIVPAPIIHLALRFPRTRKFLIRRPQLWFMPYVIPLVLFVLIKLNSTAYWNVPPLLDLLNYIYLLLGPLIFLVLMAWNSLRDSSALVKLQSKAIFLGMLFGFFIPVIELLLRFTLNIAIFPDPTAGFVFFLFLFPLSIGFTIVKYDLFAIDTVIKRTYGYLLTTGAIAGSYGLFVLVTNLIFGRFQVTQSPIFPVIFILAVVFLFNPIRNRVQRIIDRVFYRLEYDYQETVSKISETMRSLLNLDVIGKNLMNFALQPMFVDSGSVLLYDRDSKNYELLISSGKREDKKVSAETVVADLDVRDEEESDMPADREHKESDTPKLKLKADELLIQKIAERKKEVTIYDIQSDPFFESEGNECEKAFNRLGATLVVPLIYEESLTGLITLGQKKSGKFYRREDINLLNILANQGAVAIENALMVEDVVEKERMEEELTIARDLQVSMLPAECPAVEGLDISAYSVSAREVGGDFYDFIDIGENVTGFVIGDVTGKSVSGALVMSASRSVFRMLSEEKLSVSESMMRANSRLKKDVKSGMFVALLYAVLDSRDKTLTLCSAGQTQPVLMSSETADAILVETQGDTFPLGILEEANYEETRLQLQPGDKVVFYTDGIVEAMNEQDEIFGFDRLQEVIKTSHAETSELLMNEIMTSVKNFTGDAPQHDDLTVIVVKVAE